MVFIDVTQWLLCREFRFEISEDPLYSRKNIIIRLTDKKVKPKEQLKVVL